MNETSQEISQETVNPVDQLLRSMSQRRKDSLAVDVAERVSDALCEEKVAETAKKLQKAVVDYQTKASELRKLDRPDVKTYNADGSVSTESYRSERLKKIQSETKTLGKQKKNIEAALTGDFSKLN